MLVSWGVPSYSQAWNIPLFPLIFPFILAMTHDNLLEKLEPHQILLLQSGAL
jgi:hypothetical protein